MPRLLLISNSTLHGSGYLDHCASAIASRLGPAVKRVGFVPYALHDRDSYAARAQQRFARMGYELESVHAARDPRALVSEVDALFIGGGNTFRLLFELQRTGLLEMIRSRALAGMPYIGSSAGSNVACVTIKTTNDMPIVQPASFDALALVPFNINAHYLDPIPGSTHMGETREQRIREFHEMNDVPVVGLREGAWLLVDDATVTLQGSSGARLFQKGVAAEELTPPARLDFLLA
jgi:dipeptidase E